MQTIINLRLKFVSIAQTFMSNKSNQKLPVLKNKDKVNNVPHSLKGSNYEWSICKSLQKVCLKKHIV